VREKGIFVSRMEICNPTLRAFMGLKEGQEAHYDIQVWMDGGQWRAGPPLLISEADGRPAHGVTL
jgi:hypothetical protein